VSDDLNFEEDANAIAPKADTLAAISNLVSQQLSLETRIANGERLLKELKEELRQIQEGHLPEAMLEARTSKFKTFDGVTVEIAEELTMSIPKSRKSECYDWLKQNDLGALVAPEIVVKLQKGQDNEAAMVQQFLAENGFSHERREEANTTSVKAAFRTLIRQGKDVPLEMFGGFNRRKAVITLPKE
jgi:hypothetical protein